MFKLTCTHCACISICLSVFIITDSAVRNVIQTTLQGHSQSPKRRTDVDTFVTVLNISTSKTLNL